MLGNIQICQPLGQALGKTTSPSGWQIWMFPYTDGRNCILFYFVQKLTSEKTHKKAQPRYIDNIGHVTQNEYKQDNTPQNRCVEFIDTRQHTAEKIDRHKTTHRRKDVSRWSTQDNTPQKRCVKMIEYTSNKNILVRLSRVLFSSIHC